MYVKGHDFFIKTCLTFFPNVYCSDVVTYRSCYHRGVRSWRRRITRSSYASDINILLSTVCMQFLPYKYCRRSLGSINLKFFGCV